MSVETVKSVIGRFLSEKKLEVLALKGEWGVGKTYIWNLILHKNKEKIKIKNYCYVSLFGIASIAELRTAIVAKTHNVEQIGEKNDPAIIAEKSRLPSLDSIKEFASSMKSITGNYSIAFDAIAPHLIKDTIICFDDFERMNFGSIKPDELLGFISSLKEEKKCKVVLIFNEKELGDSEEVYKKYREKIIDKEIEFAPSAEEAIEIAFPQGLPSRDLAEKYAISLNIKNIRILGKIVDLIEMVDKEIKDLHESVKESAVRDIVLFVWAYYGTNEEKPSLDYILGWHLSFSVTNKGKSAKELEWDTFIGGYGFTHINKFDVAISEVIKNGYVEDTGLLNEAKNLDSEYKAGNLRGLYLEVWDRCFYGTFTDNEAELINELLASFKEAIRHVPVSELDKTVYVLRELGRYNEAEMLIDEYIVAWKGTNVFDLDGVGLSFNVRDVKIRERFKQQYEATNEKPSLEEVVKNIATNDGFQRGGRQVLKDSTANEFYELFMSENVENLSSMIYASLRYSDGEYEVVDKNVKEALLRIGKESKLNALRVSKFGIEI